MTGRVKYRPSAAPSTSTTPKPRPLVARMAQQSSASSSVFQTDNTANSKGFVLNKETIIWLVVISVIVFTTLVIVTCLLCRCTWRRRKNAKRHSNGHRHHPSLEVTDGRNTHHAWNRNAPKQIQSQQPVPLHSFESSRSVQPLNRAAVRPAGLDISIEPEIVDEASPTTPLYARSKGSRYYSGISNAWKRVSQIGRAY